MNEQCDQNMANHDYSTCPEMASIRQSLEHITNGHDELKDSMKRLTDLMERQVRLEEQSAHHGAAMGRVFESIGKMDSRIDSLEETRTYMHGSAKTLVTILVVVGALLTWGLKSQLDILQELPVRLDRIEKQQAVLQQFTATNAASIQALKEREPPGHPLR